MTNRWVFLMPFGRVGSNVLIGCLNQSSQIARVYNEPTTSVRTHLADAPLREIADAQSAWLDDFVDDGRPGIEVAKLAFSSLVEPARFLGDLVGQGVGIIRLGRQDVRGCALSAVYSEHFAAEHERVHGRRAYGQRQGVELGDWRATIDISELDRLAQRIAADARAMDRRMPGHYALCVDYSDIERDLPTVVRAVARHMGLDTFDFEVPFQRMLGDNLADRVDNHEQVQRWLQTVST